MIDLTQDVVTVSRGAQHHEETNLFFLGGGLKYDLQHYFKKVPIFKLYVQNRHVTLQVLFGALT